MSEHTERLLTPAAAQEFVRKARGKTLFVSAGQSAPCATKPGLHFPITGNVRVTRKAALTFLADAYRKTLTDKGAMCVIYEVNECVFIGRSY